MNNQISNSPSGPKQDNSYGATSPIKLNNEERERLQKTLSVNISKGIVWDLEQANIWAVPNVGEKTQKIDKEIHPVLMDVIRKNVKQQVIKEFPAIVQQPLPMQQQQFVDKWIEDLSNHMYERFRMKLQKKNQVLGYGVAKKTFRFRPYMVSRSNSLEYHRPNSDNSNGWMKVTKNVHLTFLTNGMQVNISVISPRMNYSDFPASSSSKSSDIISVKIIQ